MAIHWYERDVFVETTHVGQVVASLSRHDKIMSDVWATIYTAVVVDDSGAISYVQCGNDEVCFRLGRIEVDDPEQIIRAYHEQEKAKADAERKQADERASEDIARIKVHRLQPGDKAIVVSGRKVPIGTYGVITASMPGNYGTRVCIQDDAGNGHWTSRENIAPHHPGVLRTGGLAPGYTWKSIAADMRDPICPVTGDAVRLRSNPAIKGKIIYARNGRVGFKSSPNTEPVWANAHEIEFDRAEVWNLDPGQANSLPEPFCRAAKIEHANGKVVGYDKKGVKLFVSPESELTAIIATLGLQTPTSES